MQTLGLIPSISRHMSHGFCGSLGER